MKIDSYAVSAQAQRSSLSVTSTVVQVGRPMKAQQSNGQKAVQRQPSPAFELSDFIKRYLRDAQDQRKQALERLASTGIFSAGDTSQAPGTPEELKLSLLDQMLYALTGKHFNLKVLTPFAGQEQTQIPSLGSSGGNASMMVEAQQFTHESEELSYSAQAEIRTADGRTISVDISMNLSRSFTSMTTVSLPASGILCDPLVINYAGTAASLTGETYQFDLDCDSRMDTIHFAGEGSGFLALDRNGDGMINDGGELFGPGTGSGFGELRAYDGDRNGWIDENDAVFSKLLIWSKDKDGNDQLFTLKDLGVGAIYLGDIETAYTFKDDANSTQGVMRSTSFFLKEDGGAGTISHIDLMI